jgi:DNA polymerase-3 subunit epsilon
MIKIFYDLETTGLKPNRHGIHQLAGLVEIDGEVVETFDLKVQPNPKAEVLVEALEIAGVTAEDLAGYMPMADGYRAFTDILGKYIDKFNRKDKAHLVGYNNRAFDDIFLRAWFDQNDDRFFGSWFYSDTLDALVLASQFLLDKRPEMPTFKQFRVAMTLGIEVDKTRLHDALYDVHLTRRIYHAVTAQPDDLI